MKEEKTEEEEEEEEEGLFKADAGGGGGGGGGFGGGGRFIQRKNWDGASWELGAVFACLIQCSLCVPGLKVKVKRRQTLYKLGAI